MKNRGVSPVIATVILVAVAIIITLAAAAAMGTISIAWLGRISSAKGYGMMTHDSVKATSTEINVFVRNIGSKDLVMDKAYVDGEPCELDEVNGNITNPIPIEESRKIVIIVSLTTGEHEVELVASDGTKLEFTVNYSPSFSDQESPANIFYISNENFAVSVANIRVDFWIDSINPINHMTYKEVGDDGEFSFTLTVEDGEAIIDGSHWLSYLVVKGEHLIFMTEGAPERRDIIGTLSIEVM